MSTIIAMIIILILGIIITFLYRGWLKSEDYSAWPSVFVIIAAIVINAIIFTTASFVKVNANEVGIIYDDRYGVLEQEVKREGFQTKSVFEHITKISTTNKTSFLEVAGQTKDSIYAWFEITVVYRIDAANAGVFFKRVGGPNINEEQLNSLAKEALQSVTTNYDVYTILGESLETVRQEFVTRLQLLLLDRYAITVVSASFDDIDAGDQIEQAIQNKAKALQQIEIAEAERLEAQIAAQTKIIQANALAEAYLIDQEAKAEAVRIAADAEAYRIQEEKNASLILLNTLINDYAMTPAQASEFLQQLLYYETWNGVLPEIVTNDMLAALVKAINDQNP